MNDLDARLELLAAEATRDAVVPDPEAVMRRGRRRNRRRLASSALLVLAVTAGLTLPAWLGRRAPTTDPGAALAPATDTSGAAAASLAGYWFGRADASVFLAGDRRTARPLDPARRGAILARIRALGVVDEVFYESKAEAYARFRAQFRHQPELLTKVLPAAMPESFRVRLDDPDHFGALYRALCQPDSGRPGAPRCADGVDSVVDERAALRPVLVGSFWPSRSDVSVFLADGADVAQRQAIRARLEAIGAVRAVWYESRAEALARLPERIRNGVGPLGQTPASAPASFRVALRDPRQVAAFLEGFCRSSRTGDCFEGVAMVAAHPRR